MHPVAAGGAEARRTRRRARFGATLQLEGLPCSASISSAGADERSRSPTWCGSPRGPLDAYAAQLVSVRANQGNATLLAREDAFIGTRSDDFGVDPRDAWK
jgi:hypothetical protein